MIKQLTAMPKYEAYKDSGVEWLGVIPEHWQSKPIKSCYALINGFPFDSRLFSISDGFPIVRIRDILNNKTETFFNGRFVSEAEINNDDILIGMDGDFNVAWWLGGQALLNQRVCCIREKYNSNLRFLYYALPFLLKKINDLTFSTTVKHLSAFDILKSKIPFPPLPEQNAITAFLNCKTAQIDQALAIKEKQIALLKERKQILIQNAVTRGLNPEAPMWDSAVEWIGEIPAHWVVKRAKYLFKEVDERSVLGEEELLSVSHITGVTPRSEKNVTMFMAEDYTGSKTCQKGDLVFNTMWTWMGALGVSDKPGIVSSSYGVFRQLKENTFNPKYLEFLLKTTGYVEHYNKVSTGLHSSRLRFYSHMFFDMELGYPQKKEQDEIITHIETESTKIDQAISIQQQQIDKLKEYKATLINSAVTGKIKVPELVGGRVAEAPIPEPVEGKLVEDSVA